MKTSILKHQWFITSKHEDFTLDYTIISEIGSGRQGKVYLAIHKPTKTQRAVKIIHKNKEKEQNHFIARLEKLKTLEHPNLVTIIETYETELLCYIVSEYCEGGELFEEL